MKSKLRIVIILTIVLLILSISLIVYFIPKKLEINIIDNNIYQFKLTRSFGRCKINSKIINKTLDKDILNDLHSNG